MHETIDLITQLSEYAGIDIDQSTAGVLLAALMLCLLRLSCKGAKTAGALVLRAAYAMACPKVSPLATDVLNALDDHRVRVDGGDVKAMTCKVCLPRAYGVDKMPRGGDVLVGNNKSVRKHLSKHEFSAILKKAQIIEAKQRAEEDAIDREALGQIVRGEKRTGNGA